MTSSGEIKKKAAIDANVPQDCMACRVIGTASLGTVGLYALHQSRAHQPGTIFGKRIMAGVGILFLGASAVRLLR
ncbi:hypothetical protein OF83DRAFT_371751 [Amylostereum chailletii]|nr:hypothetical protein OF83DRAFT_371751 [Amylostereum chailletii]